MSHSPEPSYYEIALTNRQVFIVFVVLLVCVVAAFFAGVWIGRQHMGTGPALQVADEAPAEPSERSSDESTVGKLHFFSDREAPVEEEPAPAETTLLQDLTGQEAAEGAPKSSTPSPAVETPPPPTEGHVIQVFSSSDEAQARSVLSRLKKGGYPAFLSPVEVGGQTMFRVRIGPYSQLQEAEAVAGRVRRGFKLDTWVTH